MKLFVGNLPWTVGDLELLQLFEPVVEVTSAHVVLDKDTGRSGGFGIVEISDDEMASVAISSIDGIEYNGRALRVMELENSLR